MPAPPTRLSAPAPPARRRHRRGANHMDPPLESELLYFRETLHCVCTKVRMCKADLSGPWNWQPMQFEWVYPLGEL